MSDPVRRALVAAIEEQGPLTFAAFMEHALYGPGGFYEHPPVGPDRDFVTSPHVHPVFGVLLARAIEGLRVAMGGPEPWHLVEVGAGDGTLARQLLAALDPAPVYTAVEVSVGSRGALVSVGVDRVATVLEPPAHVVVANELLDNLPFRVVRGDREVRIGLDDGRLTEVLSDVDDDLASHLSALDRGPEGGRDSVVPVGAFAFVDRLAGVLEPGGYALLIDYGAVGSSGGPLHGYRAHRLVDDVLTAPGTADVTAGVDFAAVAGHAERAGLIAFPTVTQHDALLALGFEAWFHEELTRQHAALEARDGVAAVRTWSGRSRASILADPAGLGRFRWLVLARPGAPVPVWLGSALDRDVKGRSTDRPGTAGGLA